MLPGREYGMESPVRNRSTMERQLRKQAGTYFFGEKSKLANWILNHPFQIAAGCTLLASLIAIGDNSMLLRVLAIFPPFSFGLALLLRLLCRNLCYQVEIDTKSKKITFFRCFNKRIIEAPIQSVEFRFDKHFAAIYGGERFTIFNEYMGGIIQVLSPEKEIEFSKGIYGRFMKRQFEKSRSQNIE